MKSFLKNMNLPNKLTILRILCVPVFVLCLCLSNRAAGWKVASLLIFIVASVTDTLDGYIARSRGMVSNFGKFADPLADKMLVSSALICFVQLGTLPAWIVILIVCRDFIISGLRLVAADKGIVIAASKWGKIKTATQMICSCFLIINQPHIRIFTNLLVALMTILTVVSLVDYLIKNKQVLLDE